MGASGLNVTNVAQTFQTPVPARIQELINAIDGAYSATNASYTAGTPGDWATAAPTTVKDAIDRIAAVVGGSTPIP